MRSVSESIAASGKLVLALLLASTVVAPQGAHSQSFSVIHNFSGGIDGSNPVNGFVTDRNGNFYGTTTAGGASNYGVVFRMSKAGGETVLHAFTGGTDGASPNGILIRNKAGHIYGTTTAGGGSGMGTIFEIVGKTETVLYSFAGGADGAGPQAGLALDPAGNLYGTTSGGGAHNNGTVFKLTVPKTQGSPWTEQVLHSFGNGPDGATPVAGVTLDTAGNLYGTTSAGGTGGYGIVFQLTPGAIWTEAVLHNFQNGTDGSVPYAGLVADKLGNLYGAATQGGAAPGGGGTIFKLTPANGTWNFAVLFSVPGWGISGSFRNVVLDSAGNLYGTTHCDGLHSSGTVYKLTNSAGIWTYTELYAFTGGSDGLYSFSNLVLERGALYGTTKDGGANGSGVVFKVTP